MGASSRGGTIGVMTSTQGSISINERGGHEVYRASKAALNQLMRSYAARHGTDRTLLLMDPGWVQTELGGEGAPLSVADSVRGVVTTIEKSRRSVRSAVPRLPGSPGALVAGGLRRDAADPGPGPAHKPTTALVLLVPHGAVSAQVRQCAASSGVSRIGARSRSSPW